LAELGLHDDTPVGPVVAVLQEVEVYELPLVAGAAVHELTGVGPVVVVAQVVAV